MENELTQLNQKVDQLSNQVQSLVDQAAREQRRRQNLQELQDDLIPIGNQLIRMTIAELEDIGSDFELDDLLYLLKRVLRNTQLILTMFDRVEALMGIADEVEMLGKGVFTASVEALDELERKGYFQLARSGWDMLDALVEKVEPSEIEKFSKALDPMIDISKIMLNPDLLRDFNRALTAFQAPVSERPPGTLVLLKELNDPAMRRGLSRLINSVKALDPECSDPNQ
jgi:uncharacterized protein YjgD (DUF1641 family)